MSITPGEVFLSMTRKYFEIFRSPTSDPLPEADWDNLLVLDACRYDMFERLHDLPGELFHRTSLGSTTDEFTRRNFTGRTLHDTVYVTANPRVNLALEGDEFHDVIDVWRTHWDEELATVRPESVGDVTERVSDEYPNKRIIVHFIQPHAPFIGDYARRELKGHSTLSDHLPDRNDVNRENIWTQLREGSVEIDAVRRAYDENLEVVLPTVQRLIDCLEGRTVVSSDHGNLLGERIPPFMQRLYGHPETVYARPLVEVPWLVIEGERRTITVEKPGTSKDTTVTDDVEKKLADLGYT